MQVPKRKPGKYAHEKPDPYMSQAKYDSLQAELERIQKRLPHMRKEVGRLAEMGDFSENAAYQMAKGKLRGANHRVLVLEDTLKYAKIIDKQGEQDVVALGCTVTFQMNGHEKTFTILGSSEADPTKNIISQHSPLGASLLGAKVGDVVTVRIGDNDVSCKILKIT